MNTMMHNKCLLIGTKQVKTNDTLRLIWVGLFSVFLFTSCRDPRPDDDLEPNDTFEQATELTAENTIDALANQGNADVFKIDVGDDVEILTFDIESLGGENCPGFTLTNSNDQVLYEDVRARCRRVGQPKIHESSVTFEIIRDYGYKFQIQTTTPGYYYLTIVEGSDADNFASYRWKYRLTAEIE